MKTKIRVRRRFRAALLAVGGFLFLAGPEGRASEPVIDQIQVAYESMLKKAHAKREAKEDLARRVGLFEAIARRDKRRMCVLLNEGASPDSELPFPPPASFKKRYGDSDLGYYINCEPGFTVLMLASMLGQMETVDILLTAGANPWKTTRKDKTFALWLAGKTQQVDIMRKLMKVGPSDEAYYARILVDLSSQTATLFKNDKVTMTVPISSGREQHPTPTGRYLVTNKYRDWTSTKYHARMPFFLRLSCGDFGLHAGIVPGYPASHGCIRVPKDQANLLFAVVPVGTLVEIR